MSTLKKSCKAFKIQRSDQYEMKVKILTQSVCLKYINRFGFETNFIMQHNEL